MLRVESKVLILPTVRILTMPVTDLSPVTVVAYRPSRIDSFLAAHSDSRERMRRLAVDPATSVDAMAKAFRAIGFEGSRSRIGEWQRKQRQRAGTFGSNQRRLMLAVLSMTDPEVDRAIAALPERLQALPLV